VIDLYKNLLRSAVFNVDPETAHHLALKALSTGLLPSCAARNDPRLSLRLFDLDFPNPLGIAAGFDKNAEVVDPLFAQGFGFVEVGTVTPLAQPGNPKPRLFRLPADNAVINRFGFNNEGHAAMRARLLKRRSAGVLAVNVGANKDAADRTADYVAGIRAFADLASMFTVNISSPNTPGLRDLQARSALSDLVEKCLAARDEAADSNGRKVPVFVKIAPDLDEAAFADIVEVLGGSAVDGVIVSNTTITRDGLHDTAKAKEAGGLSGRPLFERSTIMLARMHLALGPDKPLIGVGGVDSGETAFAKIAAGASLVQLYTALVYEGLGLVGRILDHLTKECDRRGLASINDAVGIDAKAWAAKDA